MGYRGPVVAKAMRFSSKVRRLAVAAAALLLLALLPVFQSLHSRAAGSPSVQHANRQVPEEDDLVSRVGNRPPAALLPHLDLTRNDSNDGSCAKLRRDYPDLSAADVKKYKRKRYAVVTYSDGLGSKREHYCKVRANHCAYAAQGGADCVDNRNLGLCVDGVSLQALHLVHPAAWAKISVVQHCCRHYEYVLLLDADVVVMDGAGRGVGRFAREAGAGGADVTMTGTGVPGAPFNSGLLGVRCGGAGGAALLRGTLRQSRSMAWRMHGLWEQRSMTKVFLEDAGVRAKTLLVLPERATQCYPKAGECSAEDFAVHFLGDKAKYERQFLRYFCQSRVSSGTVEGMRAEVC